MTYDKLFEKAIYDVFVHRETNERGFVIHPEDRWSDCPFPTISAKLEVPDDNIPLVDAAVQSNNPQAVGSILAVIFGTLVLNKPEYGLTKSAFEAEMLRVHASFAQWAEDKLPIIHAYNKSPSKPENN